MAGSLDDYRKKRDFRRTPEPQVGDAAGREAAPVYVVHRHEARRLHYDLRLEVEGALSSWAVPKGFSYDPSEKRLAVRTEDHPLEYEHFHGVIPKGQYGAGTMTIWDRGTFEVVKASSAVEAIRSGELKVRLYGRKLRGEWHLVRTRADEGRSWLLFKSKDAYSGPARDTALGVDLAAARERALPRAPRAMEAGGTAAPFSDPEWLFEMEFSGIRTFAVKDGERVRLPGLRAEPAELALGLQRLRCERALLDGVLVALDPGGRPSRELAEARLAGRSDAPLALYAFDLLHWEDYDLRALALVDRKAALRSVLPDQASVLFVDHVPGSGERLLEAVEAAGLPGAVAKRARSAYAAGPSDDWRRIPARAAAARPAEDVAAALASAGGRRASRVQLTNLGKVFWPAEGFTKGDLVGYYEAVADALLPHLHERPTHMNRFPDGIEGKSFYQRQVKEDAPAWLETLLVESDSHAGPVPHMLPNDRDHLLYMVNAGSIDLHPWMSRRGSLDWPDWSVLDLDPKEAPFEHVVRLARAAGRILRGIGLRPLLKTSGSTGLHVYVPLSPGYTYEQSRMFCEAVARAIAREHPDVATVERHVGSREGKVYLDFLQNRRSQTIVPPYSVRPVRGAQVSTPLHWDELEEDPRPARFTIQTVPRRLEELGELFLPALTDGQDLLPAIGALETYLERSR